MAAAKKTTKAKTKSRPIPKSKPRKEVVEKVSTKVTVSAEAEATREEESVGVSKEAVLRRAQKALDIGGLVKSMNSSMKKEIARSGDDASIADIGGYFETGVYPLDCFLGKDTVGGLPFGRITEVFAPNHQGKSTWIYSMLAKCQRGEGRVIEWYRHPTSGRWRTRIVRPELEPGIAILVDTEFTFDKARAEEIGIDTESLFHLEAHNLEDVFESLKKLLKHLGEPKYAKVPILIAWDTIAASQPKTLLEGTAYEGGIALKPRMVRHELSKLIRPFAERQICLVVSNQVTSQIGAKQAGSIDSPGGHGLKHFASLRFSLRRVAGWKESQHEVGFFAKARPIKSKIACPDFDVTVPIRFSSGVDDGRACLERFLDAQAWDKVPVTTSSWSRFVDQDGSEWKFQLPMWSERYSTDEEFRTFVRSMIRRNILDGAATYAEAAGT